MLQTFSNVANSDGLYGAHRRFLGTPQEDRYKQAAEDDRASWCAREFHHHYRVGFPMLDGSDPRVRPGQYVYVKCALPPDLAGVLEKLQAVRWE